MADNQTYGGRWVKVAVSLQQHWLWERPLYLKWWLDLVMLAEWRDRKRAFGPHVVTVKRGQLVASLRYLQLRWQYRLNGTVFPAQRTVLRFLRLLEEEDMITREFDKTPRGEALITICNYERYQPNLDTPESSQESSDEIIKYTANDTTKATTNDTGNDTSSDSSEDSKIIEYIDNIERIEVVEDSSSNYYYLREREKNQEWLEKFFSDEVSIQTHLKQLSRDNEKIRTKEDFKSLARDVISEWEQNQETHADYTAWAKHLINHIRKINRINGSKNKKAVKGRVADRGGDTSGSTSAISSYGLKE